MRLSEQEIINAVCLHIAGRKQIRPMDVEVELAWDEHHGFSAEVFAVGRSQILIEANLLEAIQRYLLQERGIRVFGEQIKLDVETEIFADIAV